MKPSPVVVCMMSVFLCPCVMAQNKLDSGKAEKGGSPDAYGNLKELANEFPKLDSLSDLVAHDAWVLRKADPTVANKLNAAATEGPGIVQLLLRNVLLDNITLEYNFTLVQNRFWKFDQKEIATG